MDPRQQQLCHCSAHAKMPPQWYFRGQLYPPPQGFANGGTERVLALHHEIREKSEVYPNLDPIYSRYARKNNHLYKSAPSSPRLSHHQRSLNAVVAQSQLAKKVEQAQFYQVEVPSPCDTGNTSGCCGHDFSLRRRNSNRRRYKLSGSYSALDTAESEDESPPRKPMSVKVKSLVQWMSSVGDKVGKSTKDLLEALPSLRDEHHVVMIGLDSAGKTTVLYRLKFDQYVNTVPTIGFNCEKVRTEAEQITFHVWDVGGQEKARPLWRPYTRCTDGIIFVVDSCDVERLEEAKLELHRIMRTQDNLNTPLLVIANKQDLPEARNPTDIELALSLSDLRQLWHLEAVCAVTGEGLDLAMDRLHELILKRKKMSKRARNKTR